MLKDTISFRGAIVIVGGGDVDRTIQGAMTSWAFRQGYELFYTLPEDRPVLLTSLLLLGLAEDFSSHLKHRILLLGWRSRRDVEDVLDVLGLGVGRRFS